MTRRIAWAVIALFAAVFATLVAIGVRAALETSSPAEVETVAAAPPILGEHLSRDHRLAQRRTAIAEWEAARHAAEVAAAEAARVAEEARLAAEQAAVEAQARRPAPRAEGGEITGDVWWQLALCESGGTNASTGNGYYGYFQFLPSTWRSVGGSGLPTDHGYEEQRHRAQILQQRSGWGQWPACSRQLGLR